MPTFFVGYFFDCYWFFQVSDFGLFSEVLGVLTRFIVRVLRVEREILLGVSPSLAIAKISISAGIG